MCKRFFYTVRMASRYWSVLKNYRRTANLQTGTVQELDLSALKGQGVKVLVLDFDGVLASHGERTPAKELDGWLKEGAAIFGPKKVFILSNKPTSKRQRYFAEHYPEIQFEMCQKKKPYPDGLQHILAVSGAEAKAVLIVDDRLLTGILAAIIAGAQARWLTNPKINLCKRPLQELFFILLRKMERLVF